MKTKRQCCYTEDLAEAQMFREFMPSGAHSAEHRTRARQVRNERRMNGMYPTLLTRQWVPGAFGWIGWVTPK